MDTSEVFEGSLPAVRSSLDIFSTPLTDKSVLKSDYLSLYPVSSIQEAANPLEFSTGGISNQYLDLYNS